MKTISILICALSITGCATTTPIRTQEGAWMVQAQVPFTGPSGALEKAIGEANIFCASQGAGQVPKLVSNTTGECMLHGGCGTAQITFACAKSGT
jgi:hypothetical protein